MKILGWLLAWFVSGMIVLFTISLFVWPAFSLCLVLGVFTALMFVAMNRGAA